MTVVIGSMPYGGSIDDRASALDSEADQLRADVSRLTARVAELEGEHEATKKAGREYLEVSQRMVDKLTADRDLLAVQLGEAREKLDVALDALRGCEWANASPPDWYNKRARQAIDAIDAIERRSLSAPGEGAAAAVAGQGQETLIPVPPGPTVRMTPEQFEQLKVNLAASPVGAVQGEGPREGTFCIHHGRHHCPLHPAEPSR